MFLVRSTALVSVFVIGLSYGSYSSAASFGETFAGALGKWAQETVVGAIAGNNDTKEKQTIQTVQTEEYGIVLDSNANLRTSPDLQQKAVTTTSNPKLSGSLKIISDHERHQNSNGKHSNWYRVQNTKTGNKYWIHSSQVPDQSRSAIKSLAHTSALDSIDTPQNVTQYPIKSPQNEKNADKYGATFTKLPPLPVQNDSGTKTNCQKGLKTFKVKGTNLICNQQLEKGSCITKVFQSKDSAFKYGKEMPLKGVYINGRPEKSIDSFDRIIIDKEALDYTYQNTRIKGKASSEIFDSKNDKRFNYGNGKFCTDAAGKLAIYRMVSTDRHGNKLTKNLVLGKADVTVAQPQTKPPKINSQIIEDIDSGDPIGR